MLDGTIVKLIIIGDSSVGKTQMMLRFTDDTFSATTLSTVGVDFKVKEVPIEGVPYRVQLWDTAGQERFRNITESYFRRANGIAIVFDISVSATFDSVPTWFDSVESKCNASDSLPVVLVGNKCDLTPQITYDRAKEVADRYHSRYYETSALNGTGIQEAFTDLIGLVVKNNELKRTAAATAVNVDAAAPKTAEKKKGFC